GPFRSEAAVCHHPGHATATKAAETLILSMRDNVYREVATRNPHESGRLKASGARSHRSDRRPRETRCHGSWRAAAAVLGQCGSWSMLSGRYNQAALLVFLSAAARARIVAADLEPPGKVLITRLAGPSLRRMAISTSSMSPAIERSTDLRRNARRITSMASTAWRSIRADIAKPLRP